MSSKKLVYSTESGRHCPACNLPLVQCKCRQISSSFNRGANKSVNPGQKPAVHLQRQIKGRNGKPVVVISGLDLDPEALKSLAKVLKQYCGTGGTIEDGNVLIQGDKRSLLVELLEKKGYRVKLSGG